MDIRRGIFISYLALFLVSTLVAAEQSVADDTTTTTTTVEITTTTTTATQFNFRTILPGSNTTITMTQNQKFPLGCPQLFVLATGSGTLTITLQKNDISDDLIFMTGLAASGARTTPIFRTGVSKGLITQSVALGSQSQTFGFVWICSGVYYSAISPAYEYTIQLSFEP